MALINWNESLSVNVKEIDLQHKKLIDMNNELNEAMKLGKGKDALGKIVNGLISYTATHFKKGNLPLSVEVMNFLSDWLKNHIKGTDKKYSKFFNEKGLK